MDRNSTPLIKYSDINTSELDLFADAYGVEYQYYNILSFLQSAIIKPDEGCILNLLDKIKS